MSMYMSDRRHVCAHVRFLGLYSSTDYSWDMTSRMPKLSSQWSAILPSTALLMIILPYSTFHLECMYILYTILGEETQTQKTRFCEFIHCREVLQTSESSLMLEHEWCTTIITGMDLVSFSYIIHCSTIAGQHTGTNDELYNSAISNFQF